MGKNVICDENSLEKQMNFHIKKRLKCDCNYDLQISSHTVLLSLW